MIEPKTPRTQYVSAGGTSYPFPWPIWEDSDIRVYVNDEAQVLDTDYTVTFTAGDNDGGTVVLSVAPTGGDIVTLVRSVTVERDYDFALSGPLSASALNTQLDKLTTQVQDLQEFLGRTPVRKPQSPYRELPLPDPSAGSLLEWDDVGGLRNRSPGETMSSAESLALQAYFGSTGAGTAPQIKGVWCVSSDPSITDHGDITQEGSLAWTLEQCSDGDAVYLPTKGTLPVLTPISTDLNSLTLDSWGAGYYGPILLGQTEGMTILTVTGYGLHLGRVEIRGDGTTTYAAHPTTMTGLVLARGDDPNVDATLHGTTFSFLDQCVSMTGRNVNVQMCLFSTSRRGIQVDEYGTDECRGVVIQNNRFHFIGWGWETGISDSVVIEALDSTYTWQWTVTNNTADYCQTFYKGPTNENKLDDNHIYMAFGGFVFNASSGARRKKASCSRNTIIGNVNLGGDVATTNFLEYGIQATAWTLYDLVAEDNQISNTRRDGILIDSAYRCSFRGTVIHNPNLRDDVDGHVYAGVRISGAHGYGGVSYCCFDDLVVTHDQPHSTDPYLYAFFCDGIFGHSTAANMRGMTGSGGVFAKFDSASNDQYSYASYWDAAGTGLCEVFPYKTGGTRMRRAYQRNNNDLNLVTFAYQDVDIGSATAGAEKGYLYFGVACNGTLADLLALKYNGATSRKEVRSLGTLHVDDALVRTPKALQTLSAGTTIVASDSSLIQIDCSGAVATTAAPTIADGVDGQVIRILNTGGAAGTYTLKDQATLAGSNLRLTASTVALAPRQSIELTYSAAVGDWVQTGPLVTVI